MIGSFLKIMAFLWVIFSWFLPAKADAALQKQWKQVNVQKLQAKKEKKKEETRKMNDMTVQVDLEGDLTRKSKPIAVMDLVEVIRFAYENNPDLKAAIAEKQSRDEALAQAFSEYYPDIALRISSGRIFSRESNVGKNNIPSKLDRSSYTETTAALVLSQNLFSGLGTKYKLESAEASVIANRHSVSAKIQEFIMKIVSAYMELWYTEQLVTISRKLENNLKESLESEYQKLQVGTTNVQEYQAKKSAYADAQYRLSDAVAKYNSALAEFKMITCMNANGRTIFPDISKLAIPKTLNGFISKALANNPTLLSAKFSEFAASKQVNVSKSELAPRVDFEVSAERDFKTNYRRKLKEGDSQVAMRDGRHPKDTRNNLYAKINVTMPILKNGGSSYSHIRQNHKAALKAAYEYKNVLLKIEQECRSVWAVYQAALAQIEQSRRAVESARITVEGFRKSEELGKVSATDVIYNERNLLERRQQAAEANKKLVDTIYRIVLIQGMLEEQVRTWNIRTYDLIANERRVRRGPIFYK